MTKGFEESGQNPAKTGASKPNSIKNTVESKKFLFILVILFIIHLSCISHIYVYLHQASDPQTQAKDQTFPRPGLQT